MKKIEAFCDYLMYKDDWVIKAFIQMVALTACVAVMGLLTIIIVNIDWLAWIAEKLFYGLSLLVVASTLLLLFFGPIKLLVSFIKWYKLQKK